MYVGYYPTSAIILAKRSLTPNLMVLAWYLTVGHDGLGITHDAKVVNRDSP